MSAMKEENLAKSSTGNYNLMNMANMISPKIFEKRVLFRRRMKSLELSSEGSEFATTLTGFALGTPEFNSSVTLVNSKLVCLFLLAILTLVGHNENYRFTNNCVTLTYKISKIARALWLAERRVCMRVRKHGCDVKMFCFSRVLPPCGVITRLYDGNLRLASFVWSHH